MSNCKAKPTRGVLFGMTIFSFYGAMIRCEISDRKLPKKCLLPDCQRTTTHNGGYCSADHCRLHRQKMKKGTKQ